MSKFFINRPIMATVISFPHIASLEVQVYGVYTGAYTQTVKQSVATPIEQQMT